jgi:uncharacterized membrane protein HdeD (DUF308 family)
MTMQLTPRVDPLNPHYEQCLRMHECWLWFVVLGIAIMATGFLAIGWACVATRATMYVFGILLLAGGVVQLVNAFLARQWRGFFLHLVVGVVQLVVGGLIIEYPERAADTLTFLLAVALLVGGAVRLAFALMEDFPDRGWVMVNGFITLLLGIAIWRRWPDSSELVIGIFVGIDLIFSGWSWVMLGLLVKSAAPAAPSQATASTSVSAGAN